MRHRLWLLPVLAGLSGLPSAQAAGPAPLAYHAVQPTQAGWLSSDARVEAVRDTQLSAQVAGAIVALHVKAGDRVRAGQELLRIDARMASQGAAASQAQVAAAQANLQVAGKEYERQKQLFAKRYISQAALDAAEAQWRAARAQVQALQAQAGVAATQSGLHVLRAPYAGVVAGVPVALGDMAMPGRPLVSVYDPALLRVTASLAEEQAQRLRSGGGVQVELPGLMDTRLDIAAAQVQVLPTADPLSHTVPVRVQLPADLPGALPGSFARLWWQGGAADAGARVLVPAKAVVRRAEMTGVYVRGGNGQPQLRQVRLGPPQGEMVEVLSGLRAGDQVALEPQAAAKVR
ncbi:efflux RND transporter periplasmic adaptor subunit [Alicycliphilus sp. T452]